MYICITCVHRITKHRLPQQHKLKKRFLCILGFAYKLQDVNNYDVSSKTNEETSTNAFGEDLKDGIELKNNDFVVKDENGLSVGDIKSQDERNIGSKDLKAIIMYQNENNEKNQNKNNFANKDIFLVFLSQIFFTHTQHRTVLDTIRVSAFVQYR